jgi:hypothetical protein
VPAPGFFKVLSAGDKALKAADNAACHL